MMLFIIMQHFNRIPSQLSHLTFPHDTMCLLDLFHLWPVPDQVRWQSHSQHFDDRLMRRLDSTSSPPPTR